MTSEPMAPAGARPNRALAAALIAIVLIASPACFFRKKKAKASAPAYPASPVRLALLPLNAPSDNPDLQWLALATVAIMAREAEAATDLELVPVWQSWPVAIEALGSSRTLSEEMTAYTASRLSAKWATQGEVQPAKNGIHVLIDFIPAKATLVSFRYQKETHIEGLDAAVREAFEQFLRYLIARPLPKQGRTAAPLDQAHLREIAAALDREHGWFVSAQPGKADKEYAATARGDARLAALLFNPALYQTPAPRPANSPASAEAPRPPEAPAATTIPAPQNLPRPSAERAPVPSGGPAAERPASGPPTPEVAAAATPSQTQRSMVRIQVFSSRNQKEADALAKKLRGAGFEPEIEKVDLKEKGLWYRIRLGFAGRKAAEEAGRKLQADGLIREFWIVP